MRSEAFYTYLDECRSLVVDELQRVLPATGSAATTLYQLMYEYPFRDAKALRPALCIATCRAMGGSLESVLPTAAVLELYHNAFLIHDDIEDGSEQRRGGPTLHRMYGTPIALNVADAMLAVALEPLLANTQLLCLATRKSSRSSSNGRDRAMQASDPAARVVFEAADPLQLLLSELRRAFARHPIATQAAFSALVAEGRQFATTPEGAAWRTRLERSDWVERLHVVWDIVSMTSFSEQATDSLPSAFVDGMARAASNQALERLLSRLFEESAE